MSFNSLIFIWCSAANLPSDCINLGQGYMNFAPPKWITAAAEEALNTVGPNHYSHPKGRPRLRQAVKQFYGSQFNRDLDIESNILISSGANEGTGLSISFGIILSD
jgi:kynurenine aminotransferase